MVTIYGIVCPDTESVVYVGKTINLKERIRKHLTAKKLTKLWGWIATLRERGVKPSFEILDTCTEDNWQDMERHYIKLYKSFGAKLLNQLPGGEGGPTMKGRFLTEEQCKKISDSKRGKPNPATAKYNKLKGTPVFQFDLNGNLIAKHDSIRSAAQSIGRSDRRIGMMVNGNKHEKKVNQVGGYLFSKSCILNR